jgi:hypothetical protein
MRISVLLICLFTLFGCASKESAPQTTTETKESAAPKVVWTARADKSLAEFGASSQFNAAAISPDRRFALSGDAEGAVLLWNLANGKPLREFRGGVSKATAVAFGEDGSTVFAASADRTLRAWDVERAIQIRVFATNGRTMNAIAVAGNFLVGAGNDGAIYVWDIRSGKPLRAIRNTAALSIATTTDMIFAGGSDGTIRIYDLRSGKLLRAFRAHNGQIFALAAQNGEIYSAGSDRTIRVWETARARQKLLLRTPATVRAIAAEGSKLVSGGDDMIARFWDLASGKETHNFPANGAINAVALNGETALAASGKLQIFSAIDPNAIGFERIVKEADKFAAGEYNALGEEERKTFSIEEARAKALSKALSIYWGDPRLSDLAYDDENQSASGYVRSFYGNFSRKIRFEIEPEEALELIYNPSYDVRLVFALKNGALALETVSIKNAWGEQTQAELIGEDSPPIIFIVPPYESAIGLDVETKENADISPAKIDEG